MVKNVFKLLDIFHSSLLPALNQNELFNELTSSDETKKLLMILLLHTSQVRLIKELTTKYNDYLLKESTEFTTIYSKLCIEFEKH